MKSFPFFLVGLISFSVQAWVPPIWRPTTSPRRSKLFQSTHDEFLLTDDDTVMIEQIYAQVSEQKSLQQVLLETLSTLPPKLLMKLRQAAGHNVTAVQQVARGLNSLLADQLETATITLKSLLDAGEVRKLDSLIGKAAREGRLDAAFFNVIAINMKDAMQDTPLSTDEGEASRSQVLQHIYTRCQEEVEKNLDPGMALLNK